jgi:hypothetical protein
VNIAKDSYNMGKQVFSLWWRFKKEKKPKPQA